MSIDRVNQIEEILKKRGKTRQVDLIKILDEKGLMSPDTARKAIKEAIKEHKIFEKKSKQSSGKQDMVFLTVYPDIYEDEKYLFEQNQKLLKDIDTGLEVFRNKFSRLSIEEKAHGLESFVILLLHFEKTVGGMYFSFGKTKEWKTLVDKVHSRHNLLNDLLKSCENRERGLIGREINAIEFEYLEKMRENGYYFIKGIKSKYPD